MWTSSSRNLPHITFCLRNEFLMQTHWLPPKPPFFLSECSFFSGNHPFIQNRVFPFVTKLAVFIANAARHGFLPFTYRKSSVLAGKLLIFIAHPGITIFKPLALAWDDLLASLLFQVFAQFVNLSVKPSLINLFKIFFPNSTNRIPDPLLWCMWHTMYFFHFFL